LRRCGRIGLAASAWWRHAPQTWAGIRSSIGWAALPTHPDTALQRRDLACQRLGRQTSRFRNRRPEPTPVSLSLAGRSGASREAWAPSALTSRAALSGDADSGRSRFADAVGHGVTSCGLPPPTLPHTTRPFRPDSPAWWPGTAARSQSASDHSSLLVHFEARCARSEPELARPGRELDKLPAALMGFLALRSFAPAWRCFAFARDTTHLLFTWLSRCCFGQWTGRHELSERGRSGQGRATTASGFSAGQAVPPMFRGPLLPWAFPLPGFQTHTGVPAGSRHLGRPSVSGLPLPVPSAHELGRRVWRHLLFSV
jgi:hypothetical protein